MSKATYSDEQILEEAEMIVFEGLSYNEVGKSLEVPTSTVKDHMHNQLRKISPLMYNLLIDTMNQRRYKEDTEGKRIIDEYL
jgi:hypothetical protein